ncbi:beta-adrenergic receptor kinase 1-like [Cetorhinus maximus]
MREYSPPFVSPRQLINDPPVLLEEVSTEHIMLTESDEEFYRDFSVTIPERWAQEVVETIFWDVNRETDEAEAAHASRHLGSDSTSETKICWSCIMHGYINLMDNPIGTRCCFYLYPRKLEWRKKGESTCQVLMLSEMGRVEELKMKGISWLRIQVRGKEPMLLNFDSKPEFYQWKKELSTPHMDPHHGGQRSFNVSFMARTKGRTFDPD